MFGWKKKNQRNKQKLNIFLNISNIVYTIKVTFTLNGSILRHIGMKFQIDLLPLKSGLWGWWLQGGMAALGVRDAQCSTSTAWLCLPARHTDLELLSHCPPAHSTAALHKPPPTNPGKTNSLILVQGCTSMFGNARQFLNVMIWADCGRQT